jgi:peroxiredoxin
MVLTKTPVCEFNQPAIDFALSGVDGKIWTLQKCMGSHGLLVMFICNHCPYVKAIRSHLVRDTRALQKLGVNSVAIMSNDPSDYPEDTFENMVSVASEFEFNFPYLLDATQEVAKAYGAVCTPDFFGYNAQYQLQYRGRFDGSGVQTNQENLPRELFNAMQLVAETNKGPEQQTPSIGCSIKWKQD